MSHKNTGTEECSLSGMNIYSAITAFGQTTLSTHDWLSFISTSKPAQT